MLSERIIMHAIHITVPVLTIIILGPVAVSCIIVVPWTTTGTAGGNLVYADFADFAVSFDLNFSAETAP